MPATDMNKQQHVRDPEGMLSFYVNGKRHSVSLGTGQYSAKSTLSDYIRSVGLTGTKLVCQEAGCGACAVTVTAPDPMQPAAFSMRSICACLCPLFSVDGWRITTVEALGNEKEGYHPLQSRIAKANGSQCGYCTPGVLMTMYGFLHEKSAPTQQDIEDNFDGNLCRCTGYRAILDSMKSFGVDSDAAGGGPIDIEDLDQKLCPRSGQICSGHGDSRNGATATNDAAANGASGDGAGDAVTPGPRKLRLNFDTSLWIRPLTLEELGGLLREHAGSRVRMVFGNTAAGIYKDEGPFDVYIDISNVKELSTVKVLESGVQLGANLTLSSLIAQLESLQKTRPGFAYFEQLLRHLRLVGNVLMRNAASLGGNLCLKYAHPDFPSDVFTMFEAAGASVSIYDSGNQTEVTVPLADLLTRVDMKGKVLTSVHLPELHPLDHYHCFKIAPRSQNAHAYVNAAFKIKVTVDQKQILGQPSFVFGGIDEQLVHAETTEQFFTGKEITSQLIKGTGSLSSAVWEMSQSS